MRTPTMQRRMVLMAALGAAGAALTFSPANGGAVAWADAPPAPPPPPAKAAAAALVVNAEVVVLHATTVPGPGSVPQGMPQLTKPPFSVFNTYRILDKKIIPLPVGNTGPYTLPNNRVLQVTFVNQTPDKRLHIRVAINQPGGNAYLKLLEVTAGPNETFFVAGQPYNGGVLVLGITLRP
jgi:hypothetical protein